MNTTEHEKKRLRIEEANKNSKIICSVSEERIPIILKKGKSKEVAE